MSISLEVDALHVADEDFLVASMIDRCPKTMMLRELVKNALEAASLAPEARKLVEIRAVTIGGVPKLSIWNTGPGMSDTELYGMCDLAASIGKEKGLDANFGMGAKVASLSSNRVGLRYRSCKDGVASEVILCQRDGIYGRLKRYDEHNELLGQVIDVTDLVATEGQDISSDWTEVVLMGNRPEQDTVLDPYDGNPNVDRNWIGTYLYHRFFSLPIGVEVRLAASVHAIHGARQFETIPQREAKFTRTETVDVGGGIFVHYLYDQPYERSPSHNCSSVASVSSGVSTCSLVYRDEMYDVHKGRDWTFSAPVFGVPFGARHISVHVEIPGESAVLPDGYRQFLRYRDGEQQHVTGEDFAALVRDNRPEWLREIIRSFAPQTGASNDAIRDELQRLLNDLRVTAETPRVEATGQI